MRTRSETPSALITAICAVISSMRVRCPAITPLQEIDVLGPITFAVVQIHEWNVMWKGSQPRLTASDYITLPGT
jgi:hypothetical protein